MKPPLGLMPCKFSVISHRNDIADAIDTYRDAKKEIPNEWVKERERNRP